MSKVFVVLGIASLALLIWVSASLIKDHNANGSQLLTNIDHMQRLLIFSAEAPAYYETHNTGHHKIGDKYTYIIKGKTYEYQMDMENPPQTTRFDVEYLPDNPDIHSIDSAKQLGVYKKEWANKQSISPLKCVLLFIGLCGLIYSVKKLWLK